MQTLQDDQYYQHGQEPTSASTVVASVFDPHSRVSTATEGISTKVDHSGHKVPPVIPLRTTDHRRTLVICFDGTGDQFQNDNSNVVKFVSMLTKEEDKQLAGVGTYNTPHIVDPWRAKIRLWIDLMFAGSLDAHIMGGYEFLMQNYRHGDKISIFGFSRGAYTARCLAGVLDIVGLLPPGNQQQVPFLYRIYRDTFVQTTTTGDEILIGNLKLYQMVKGWFKRWFTKPGPSRAAVAWKQAIEFKKAFSVREVTIDFLGVWDTVESVGLVPAQRPFAPSDGIIRIFRHALSLDEHRSKFRPEFWTRPTKFQKTEAGIAALQKPAQPTSVEEVWFAGCHCDIGGGSVSNEVPYSLARIPLRWMVRECFKTNTGILFHADKFQEIGMDPASVYRDYKPNPEPLTPGEQFRIKTREKDPLPIDFREFLKDPRSQSLDKPRFSGEEEEELQDTMSAVYDQLDIHPWWKIVEILPLPYRYQTADNDDWKIRRSWNMGKPRIIPQPQSPEKLKVHRSVRTRMMAEYKDETLRARGERYKPRPILFQGSDFGTLEDQVQWVD